MHFDDSSKLNNRGFSLVELLIAISILAIAIVPVLHSFISSINLNSNSREKLDTTMVGQSLLETLKNTSYSDIEKQFELVSEKEASSQDWNKFKLLPSSQYKGSDGSVISKVKSETDSDGVLTVKIQDIRVEAASDKLYDALIEIDPAAYGSETSKKGYTIKEGGTLEEIPLDYNEQGLAAVNGMNKFYDGIYNYDTVKENEQKGILDIIKKQMVEKGQITDSFDLKFENLDRKFRIVITDDGKGGEDVAPHQVANVYTEFWYGSSGPYYANEGQLSKQGYYPVYNNLDVLGQNVKLQTIYMFYFPAYCYAQSDTGDSGIKSDSFVVENKDDVKFTLAIIKQKNTLIENDPLTALELSYGIPKVNLIEKTASDQLIMDVCSNLNINLGNQSSIVDDSTYRTYFSKNGSSLNTLFSDTFNPFKLFHTEKGNRIFDVKIEVYKQGYYGNDEDDDWTTTGKNKGDYLVTNLTGSKIH